jgi:hypothetical protein
MATLDDVVGHYSGLDIERLHADGEALLRPLALDARRRRELLAQLVGGRLDRHARAVERKREEHALAPQPLVARRKLGLGQRERVAQVQAAIAAEPRPIHVPRERPPTVVFDEGPLILVETRKDLRQMSMPFDPPSGQQA